jgi:hypothetical protein
VQQVRLVDAVQHQVGQRDWVDQVLFFAAIKGACLERFDLVGCGAAVFDLVVDVCVGLRQETAGAAAGS